MNILIVDDVPLMRMVLKRIIIDHCGIEESKIMEANNGEEAIEIYTNYDIDLVFLDILMPGYDGITMVRKLKTIDDDVKIIMCTASSADDDVKECIRAGAKNYIKKPPIPERIKAAMDEIKQGGMGAL